MSTKIHIVHDSDLPRFQGHNPHVVITRYGDYTLTPLLELGEAHNQAARGDHKHPDLDAKITQVRNDTITLSADINTLQSTTNNLTIEVSNLQQWKNYYDSIIGGHLDVWNATWGAYVEEKEIDWCKFHFDFIRKLVDDSATVPPNCPHRAATLDLWKSWITTAYGQYFTSGGVEGDNNLIGNLIGYADTNQWSGYGNSIFHIISQLIKENPIPNGQGGTTSYPLPTKLIQDLKEVLKVILDKDILMEHIGCDPCKQGSDQGYDRDKLIKALGCNPCRTSIQLKALQDEIAALKGQQLKPTNQLNNAGIP